MLQKGQDNFSHPWCTRLSPSVCCLLLWQYHDVISSSRVRYQHISDTFISLMYEVKCWIAVFFVMADGCVSNLKLFPPQQLQKRMSTFTGTHTHTHTQCSAAPSSPTSQHFWGTERKWAVLTLFLPSLPSCDCCHGVLSSATQNCPSLIVFQLCGVNDTDFYSNHKYVVAVRFVCCFLLWLSALTSPFSALFSTPNVHLT